MKTMTDQEILDELSRILDARGKMTVPVPDGHEEVHIRYRNGNVVGSRIVVRGCDPVQVIDLIPGDYYQYERDKDGKLIAILHFTRTGPASETTPPAGPSRNKSVVGE